jgi:hypothetical protein
MNMLAVLDTLKERPAKRGSGVDVLEEFLAKRVRGVDLGGVSGG